MKNVDRLQRKLGHLRLEKISRPVGLVNTTPASARIAARWPSRSRRISGYLTPFGLVVFRRSPDFFAEVFIEDVLGCRVNPDLAEESDYNSVDRKGSISMLKS